MAMVLHLLAPLGHGCPRFDVAKATYSAVRVVAKLPRVLSPAKLTRMMHR